MRTLLFMLFSVTVLGQKVDREKVRNEYALEFAKFEHRAHQQIGRRLWKHPVFFGDEFNCPREFRIYKVDCPPDTILLDSDMYLKVPVGTKIRLSGEETIGHYKMYELRVDLPEYGVVRTYLHTYELDDLFFPENEHTKASFYMNFEKRKREILKMLMAKYKISAEEIASTLWDMN